MNCTAAWCRQPVVVKHLGLWLCDTHWGLVCDATDRDLPHDSPCSCDECKPAPPVTQKLVREILKAKP